MDLGPWALPLGVLAIGGVVAFAMSRSLSDTSNSGEEQASNDEDEQSGLELRKASLLKELRELESSRSNLEPAVYDERRADIVAQGARIVEAISMVEGGVRRPSSGGLWLVGTVIGAFLLFVIIFAKEAAQPRMDGEGMTGGGVAGQPTAPQLVDPLLDAIQEEMESALATLEAEPHNLEALNFLTHHAIMGSELATAMQWSITAREFAPLDKEVIVHSAALAMRVGMHELALERLNEVLEQEPSHLEARWWLAVAVANTGDFLGSKEAVAPLLGVGGEYGQLANLLTIDLDIAMADQASSSAPSDQTSLAEEESSPEEESSEVVSLVISLLEPERYNGGGTLFVAAVRSPSGGGPPLAARRIDSPVIPMELTIGLSDSIFPGDWPEEFWVRARIDIDGDPATDSAGEFVSELWGPVSIGEEVDLVLAPVQ